MASIRIKTGPNKGREYAIADAPLTIGREETQVIQVLDQGVSRAHAEVFRIGEMNFIRDNNSTNGTFVNDVKVTEESLKEGDEILIGATILVLEDAPPPGGSGPEGAANAEIDAAPAVAEDPTLEQALDIVCRSLLTALEIVDPGEQGHARRTADVASAIAAQLGLSAEEARRVRLAALLHDVGKLAVPGVGGDPRHVGAGERILAGIEGFEQILPGVKYHHERADGSGYPYKIRNADTPVLARIVMVANAFDNACTRGGAGGQGLPAQDVIQDMAGRGGTQFDEDVIKALLACHRNGVLHGPPGGGTA